MGFIEILLRGLCVGVAASITVGPVAVLCIQRTLSRGRRAGFFSGLGVAAADTLMAGVAYFCYALLEQRIDEYSQLLQIAAGIFVVIMGVYIFFQNPVTQIRRNRAGKCSPTQDFVSIFTLSLANVLLTIPYILTFFAIFRIPTEGEVVGGALITAGFFAGAVVWWTGLTLILNPLRRHFRPRYMLTINHVAGVIIGLLGVYTLGSTLMLMFR